MRNRTCWINSSVGDLVPIASGCCDDEERAPGQVRGLKLQVIREPAHEGGGPVNIRLDECLLESSPSSFGLETLEATQAADDTPVQSPSPRINPSTMPRNDLHSLPGRWHESLRAPTTDDVEVLMTRTRVPPVLLGSGANGRVGRVVTGDHPRRHSAKPPRAETTIPSAAAPDTGNGTQPAPPCRVGNWRGGAGLAVAREPSVFLRFQRGCPTPVAVARSLRFQLPPLRTMHAVLPHTAHRRRSPPAFGVPRQSRKGLGRQRSHRA
jgi:hypothetical protein